MVSNIFILCKTKFEPHSEKLPADGICDREILCRVDHIVSVIGSVGMWKAGYIQS